MVSKYSEYYKTLVYTISYQSHNASDYLIIIIASDI